MLKTAGAKPGRLSIPRWVAWNVAELMEIVWTVLRRKDTPPITRTMVRLIGQELTFSDRKARKELGYVPIVTRLAELTENFKKI